jgi:hypothetical protein
MKRAFIQSGYIAASMALWSATRSRNGCKRRKIENLLRQNVGSALEVFNDSRGLRRPS